MKKSKIKIYAAVLTNTSKKLKIYRLDYPQLKKYQILVKVIYASICRSQIMEIEGYRGKDIFLPHMLGHEASGIVENVGSGVKKIKKGDNVVLSWIKNNNKIYKGDKIRRFRSNKSINFGPVTTLSNYTVVAENRVTIKPKKMSFKVAALYGCAVLTGAGMVFKQAKPKKNDKVLIIGMGAVGVSALLALKSLKIKNITIVDKNKKRLKLLEKLNVNRIWSLNEFKKKITSKEFKDFDICFECAGTTKTIELGFSGLKKNSGKLFFASHPNTKSKIKLDPYDLICGKKIFGSWGGQTTPSKDLKKIFNTFEKNKIKLDFLITRVYYLNNINKVVSDFKEGKVLKPIIKMSH